jgi:DNA polymerase-3 subunit gamma/tau
LWPEVLEEVKGKRRFTWILLSQNAQVAEVRDGTLTLSMANAGARDSFGRGGSEDILREALVVVLGADLRIATVVEPAADSRAAGSAPAPPGGGTPLSTNAHSPSSDDRDAAVALDDADLDDRAETHAELLARHLGAEIIAEEDHGA